MMHDTIQQGLQALATGNGVARAIIIVCAAAVVYLLVLAWLALAAGERGRLTLAAAGHIIVLGVVAYLVSKVLGHVVNDPRPYIVAHTHPLIPTAHDNGFPSDHTLLAALLTASVWWIDRRLLLVFASGTVLVMLGRLGVGAHHTIDVLGSVAIVVIAGLASRVVPLPTQWNRPILPMLHHVSRGIVRPIARRDPLA